MAEGSIDKQELLLTENSSIANIIKASMDITYQDPLPINYQYEATSTPMKRKSEEIEEENVNSSKQAVYLDTTNIQDVSNINSNNSYENQSWSQSNCSQNNLSQSLEHYNNVSSQSSQSNTQPPQSNTISFANKCKNNRYSSIDKGPYALYIESNDNTRIHAMTIGKIIRINHFYTYSKIDSIKNIGRNRVKLVINCPFEEANALIEQDSWAQSKLVCFIPTFLLVKQGVIRDVDTSLTKEEIIEYAQSQYKVIDAIRINKFKHMPGKGDIRVPTPVVIVSFRSQYLPQDVKLLGVRCIVEPYIQRVQQCRNCLRYGHSSQLCKNNRRCENCGNPHESNDCPNKTICVFCTGPHKSTELNICPEYARQKEIKNLMSTNNISFAEASLSLEPKYKKKAKRDSQSPPPGFQYPLAQNDFPSLPASPYPDREYTNNIKPYMNKNPCSYQQKTQHASQRPAHPQLVSTPDRNINRCTPIQENISNTLNIPSGNILENNHYKKNIHINNLKGIILEIVNKIISINCPTSFSQEMFSPQNQSLISKFLNESLSPLYAIASNNISSSDEEL